jgi:hypothetical protein
MPARLVSAAILAFWLVAAVGLVTRDLLPELLVSEPPDLRTIAGAGDSAEPARWSMQVADGTSSEALRTVGGAVTTSLRKPDGSVRLVSDVWFDAGGLLKGTPFDTKARIKLKVYSRYEIDPSGNLVSFRMDISSMADPKDRSMADPEEMGSLFGKVKDHSIEVTARGPLPMMNWTRSFAYQPRSLMQSALGPLDRLPGLQVGQRWETRIVSPLTGRIETVRAEVTRHRTIQWGKDKNPVKTLEIVHQMSPFSARTWVRPDGVVLRQEVPFPFVKLVLERLPGGSTDADARGLGQ